MSLDLTVDRLQADDRNPRLASSTVGLSSEEAAKRLAKHGKNRLPDPPTSGLLAIFFRQFLSPFIYILLIAAIVSFFLGQTPNAVFILAVLLLNSLIGTVQEYSAQKAAAALRKMVKGEAVVIRDSESMTIDVEDIVPGDYILLSSGDKVPADIKLHEAFNLSVDESLLTGESLSIAKDANASIAEDAPISEMVNHCFAGSIITHGRARGRVVATALDTQLGQIAHRVTQKRESEPPLMIRIRKFTYQVAAAILLAIVLLVVIMYLRGSYGATEMMMMTIGLAVSAIPEGLPAALTVALAIGMQRMAKNSVIIRKLVAVESLGSCTAICSDKTGTLTVNQLTIRRVVLPDGRTFRVSGEGIAPGGEISGSDVDELKQLCLTGLLANESHLNYAGGEWTADGDIVDVAFLVLAKKLGLSITEHRNTHRQLDLIPYESEQAFSGSLNHCSDQPTPVLNVKGSPERLVEMCSYMACKGGRRPIDPVAIDEQFEELASHGYRVIALAYRSSPKMDGNARKHLEEMTFLGMVAMIDPVRPEAKVAVERCKQGGIQVAMVTGDHPSTAKAIARDIGLYEEGDSVVTGKMLKIATAEGEQSVDQLVKKSRVFARIEPTQKEQIVSSLMKDGHLVAVTGDGVNDAPAMRRSNVGIAMGKRGTDVAKETADLIITDDNFASIVDGIEQGRIVYANIRKVIALLIATGFSALFLFLCSVVAGYPMPLTAVQLLWLNLVANGMQDVALAFEPREGNELRKPPRPPSEPVFEKRIVQHVLISGAAMGALAFGVYSYLVNSSFSSEYARNLTLMLMVLFGNIHALSSRSETRSLFSMSLLTNPFLTLAVPIAQIIHIVAMYTPGLSDVLGLSPITIDQWLSLAGIALVFLLIEELHKFYLRSKDQRP